MGMAAGVVVAFGGQAAYRAAAAPRWWRAKHTTATVLAGGAAFALAGSLAAGAGALPALSSVLEKYAGGRPGYDAKVRAARREADAAEEGAREALLGRLAARAGAGGGPGGGDADVGVPGAAVKYDADPFAARTVHSK
jgi:hypothetical protein